MEIAGISIGEKLTSLAPVVSAISDRGVVISRGAVTNWRNGKASGSRVVYKINAAEVSDGSKKDYAYWSLARAAVGARRPGGRFREHLLSSANFTEDVARDINIAPQQVRKALRAIRAEIVFGYKELDNDHQQIFQRAVNKFIDDFSKLRTSSVPPFVRTLESWAGTIPTFYEMLYQRGPQTIGIWTPYEAPFMRFFYQNRIALGSPLSSFDRAVLTGFVNGDLESKLVEVVRYSTGIKIDPDVVETHRNFLTYGNPASPFWNKRL